MNEENERSMFIDPEILQKELVISLPILSEYDIQMMINGVDSLSEDSSSSSSTIDDEKEKPCLKRDQRRLSLLNNPNYGIILCFMEKFRSYINLKNYPLRIFEDNLISEQEKISGRFMDFHLTLLKKISSGKSTERNQFVSNMTKFAYRFNRDDGEYLDEYGYSKARIDTKLRILKNLLEQQFDRNATLKTAVADKPSLDIRSKPFGRDRFGASYWLFTDTDCFIRLFRENIDANHTWINLAKNPQELENVIKGLITDSIVRKKFPDWKFSYESFNDLSLSKKFEDDYAPDFLNIKEKTGELNPSSVLLGSSLIKTEHINLDPIVNLNRDIPSPPPSSSSFLIHNIQIQNILDLTSDQESINSEIINANRLSISSPSSNDTRDEIYSREFSQDSNEKEQQQQQKSTNNNTEVNISPQGIKRKLVDYDDTESDIESEKNEELSQDLHPIPMNNEPKNNADLPIALRRSRRGGGSRIADFSPDSSSTTKSSQSSTKKRSMNGKSRNSSHSFKINGRRQHRRGRSKKSVNGCSSTTSDERQPSEDELSEDYFPNNTELDKLLNGDFPEEEEDDDDDIPRRMAKTVAQCSELSQIQSKPCSICSQTDRPEFLLLCEDCNDAYHLECVKPELFSIPDEDWYCPLCEHKHLSDGLIEKLIILLKDEKDFEMKRRLYVSKRRKRLTNVTVNLDRYVRQPPPPPPSSSSTKQQIKRIISSDEDKQSETKKTNSTIDDDDVDSVYGCKNDENRKPSDQDEEEQQGGKRRVRSCRRKPQNYSLDDYDKKMKEAMIEAGINKELVEIDSDDSDEIIFKKKSSKKRARYEEDDDDFDISDGKRGDNDFVPSRRRPTNDNSRTMNDDSRTMNDDSRSDARDYNDFDDDIGMSDDDNAWRDRRQSSVSSISKKKSKPKSNKNNERKPLIVSDDDTISYDPDANSLSPVINVKSEPTMEVPKTEYSDNVFAKNELVKNVYDKNKIVENVVYTNEAANINKPRRKPAPKKKKKPAAIQEENVTEDEGKPRPPPKKRQPGYKWRDSNESSEDDDDDYEKAAHKRRLFHTGKAITRTSIINHVKKLVGDEDDDEEEEEEEEENGEGSTKEYDELRLSDDDDFPDDQEILKTTGLANLKKPLNGQKTIPFRAPFMPSMQSYQFAMVDPTAQFEFTLPPEAPVTEPSDSSQANGNNNLPPTT